MKYKITLNGGPLDGAVVDLEPTDPQVVPSNMAPRLMFGGLIYDVDLDAGVGQYVSGQDEQNILGAINGEVND